MKKLYITYEEDSDYSDSSFFFILIGPVYRNSILFLLMWF